ncbi:hypothetical protein NPIL_643171 [Nephila pilipes]|uniref:Uncharacterized protein n=1 Tax=Nephila pilipes TaxID=299642 RepID=A0A8X6QU04_NEPPI|nr:hypothetical protein NPIL_643171 [Nephila pilipes]
MLTMNSNRKQCCQNSLKMYSVFEEASVSKRALLKKDIKRYLRQMYIEFTKGLGVSEETIRMHLHILDLEAQPFREHSSLQ